MKRFSLWLLMMICLAFVPALAEDEPASWVELMKKMDWESPSCAYTVGSVSVSRTGDVTTISGGTISNVVRFAHQTAWDYDYQQEEDWHTESGTYIFRDITLMEDVYVWAHKGENYHIVFEDTAVTSKRYPAIVECIKGANVHLENHTELLAPLTVSLDSGTSFTLSGSGIIPSTFDEDMRMSLHMNLNVTGIGATNAEAVQRIEETLQKNVHLEMKQFQGAADGKALISLSTDRMPDDEKRETFELEDQQEWLPVLGSEAELSSDQHRGKPRVIVHGNHPLKNKELELCVKYYINEQGRGDYEVCVYDENGHAVHSDDPVDLYLPYPDRLDYQTARDMHFEVQHLMLNGTEVFSTRNGTAQCTPYGVRVRVTSFSPFSILVDDTPAPLPAVPSGLPRTGDHAMPLVWLFAMLASASVLFLRRRCH